MKTIKELYRKYKNYIRVDLIMYIVMLLIIIIYILFEFI